MNLVHRSRCRRPQFFSSTSQRWSSRWAHTTSALATTLCLSSPTTLKGSTWLASTVHGFHPMQHSVLHSQIQSSSQPLRSFAVSSSSPTSPSSSSTRQTLDEQEMTRHALDIVQKAIQAVDPAQAVRSHFRRDGSKLIVEDQGELLNLEDFDEIVLVAFGKASSAMAATVLEQLMKDYDTNTLYIPRCSGVVICKDDHGTPEEVEMLSNLGVQVQMASHPVPDDRSVSGASTLLELVQARASGRTLVVCCISGGGSALFCQPTAPLTLGDLQAVNSVLLASGMGIQEMNVIRKRLEAGKGGRLAAACQPSQLVTLVLSDVLGDPLDLIASGPTVPDSSTWRDAWDIVRQYQLEDQLPEKVVTILRSGLQGDLPDSPTPDHPSFQTARTVLVGNNALAVEAAAQQAKAMGYTPVILGTQIEGEAKEIPHVYTAMAMQLQRDAMSGVATSQEFSIASPSKLPIALIAGGETTVSMPSNATGKGGRNQELALSGGLLLERLDLRNVVLASVGTDGTDGPTDAAGAVVDATTFRHDREDAREALRTHNSYPFLERLGKMQEISGGRDAPPPLIRTGPTGTNVADICVTLIGSPQADT